MKNRLGWIDHPHESKPAIKETCAMSHRLKIAGGYPQQERMIRDKQRSLANAVKYSYQGAFVKKHDKNYIETMGEKPPARALINPNKLKQDYDDKIISIDFIHDFKVGDIFEWVNTGTYWLIYLQDLTELAYFRGDIRKCSYEINWEDDGKEYSTYAAIRGPVETKIDYIQKHGISMDNPNYSLNLLMPKNEYTLKQFQRYSKFYLQDIGAEESKICWRVEAIDSISVPGILEINAIEYYSNETEDDVENGVVGGLIIKPINPNPEEIEEAIIGETFIKPKKVYSYQFTRSILNSDWSVDKHVPVELEIDGREVKIKWISNYSGQFDLTYGDYTKTIVVESLF